MKRSFPFPERGYRPRDTPKLVAVLMKCLLLQQGECVGVVTTVIEVLLIHRLGRHSNLAPQCERAVRHPRCEIFVVLSNEPVVRHGFASSLYEASTEAKRGSDESANSAAHERDQPRVHATHLRARAG